MPSASQKGTIAKVYGGTFDLNEVVKKNQAEAADATFKVTKSKSLGTVTTKGVYTPKFAACKGGTKGGRHLNEVSYKKKVGDKTYKGTISIYTNRPYICYYNKQDNCKIQVGDFLSEKMQELVKDKNISLTYTPNKKELVDEKLLEKGTLKPQKRGNIYVTVKAVTKDGKVKRTEKFLFRFLAWLSLGGEHVSLTLTDAKKNDPTAQYVSACSDEAADSYTAAGFKKAAKNAYGIEVCLFVTKNNVPVVSRYAYVTGSVDKKKYKIKDLTDAQLKKIDSKIVTLESFATICNDNRVMPKLTITADSNITDTSAKSIINILNKSVGKSNWIDAYLFATTVSDTASVASKATVLKAYNALYAAANAKKDTKCKFVTKAYMVDNATADAAGATLNDGIATPRKNAEKAYNTMLDNLAKGKGGDHDVFSASDYHSMVVYSTVKSAAKLINDEGHFYLGHMVNPKVSDNGNAFVRQGKDSKGNVIKRSVKCSSVLTAPVWDQNAYPIPELANQNAASGTQEDKTDDTGAAAEPTTQETPASTDSSAGDNGSTAAAAGGENTSSASAGSEGAGGTQAQGTSSTTEGAGDGTGEGDGDGDGQGGDDD